MKYFLALLVLLSHSVGIAQFEDHAPQTFPFLKGLKKMTDQEMINMDDTLSISSVPVFKESGEKISENDPILRDDETFNNFWPTFYSDKKGNPKAMVLIKMTEKDKDMMARLSKEMGEINQQMVGKPLPEFEGKTLSGLSVSNESLKGKTVVFNFWFVNCKPCIEEIPRLNELVKKYQNHPDIVFLSVTFDKDKKVKNLLKKQPFLYEHITHQGHGSTLIGLLNVSIFPTHMLIAPDGIVEMRDVGEHAIDLIDSFLNNLE